jgi:DNA-binding NarL/FixJ family response regulator
VVPEVGVSAHVLVLVENDPDFQLLIRLRLADDPRIEITEEVGSASAAVQVVARHGTGLVILDHWLDGEENGLEAAPRIKEAAPEVRILLISSDDLSGEALAEPAVDGFVWKAEIDRLLPTCQRLLGLEPA